MTFEQAFRSYLASQSHPFGTAVFIEQAPGPSEQSPPYAVISMVSEEPIWINKDAANSQPQSRIRSRVYQVSCFADNAPDAISAADSVRTNLDAFTGGMESFSVGACLFQSEMPTYEPDTRVHGRMQEYRILYA